MPLLVRAQADDPRALIQKAFSLQQAGDNEGAAAAYRAFLKLRPDEVGAHSNLGVVLVKLGRYDEAIEEYQAASRLAPEEARISVNLALALVKSGRLAEAAERFEALHGAMPGEKQITLQLADCEQSIRERPASDRPPSAAGTSGSCGPFGRVHARDGAASQARVAEEQVLLDQHSGTRPYRGNELLAGYADV